VVGQPTVVSVPERAMSTVLPVAVIPFSVSAQLLATVGSGRDALSGMCSVGRDVVPESMSESGSSELSSYAVGPKSKDQSPGLPMKGEVLKYRKQLSR